MQAAYENFDDLNKFLRKLQDLSEQLDPHEAAYTEVRFFDNDIVGVFEQYESLMSILDSEIKDENILNESAHQLIVEFDQLTSELNSDLNEEEHLKDVGFFSFEFLA